MGVMIGLNAKIGCTNQEWKEIKELVEERWDLCPATYDGIETSTDKNLYFSCDSDEDFFVKMSKRFPTTIWYYTEDVEDYGKSYYFLLNGEFYDDKKSAFKAYFSVAVEVAKRSVEDNIGLKHKVQFFEEGTLVADGENYFGECDVDDFENVLQFSCGDYHTVAVCSNGRVVCCGSNANGQCDFKDVRKKVKQVSAGRYHTAILFEDGTVDVKGTLHYPTDNFDLASSISSISRGKVSFPKSKEEMPQTDYIDWKNIVSIKSVYDGVFAFDENDNCYYCGYCACDKKDIEALFGKKLTFGEIIEEDTTFKLTDDYDKVKLFEFKNYKHKIINGVEIEKIEKINSENEVVILDDTEFQVVLSGTSLIHRWKVEKHSKNLCSFEQIDDIKYIYNPDNDIFAIDKNNVLHYVNGRMFRTLNKRRKVFREELDGRKNVSKIYADFYNDDIKYVIVNTDGSFEADEITSQCGGYKSLVNAIGNKPVKYLYNIFGDSPFALLQDGTIKCGGERSFVNKIKDYEEMYAVTDYTIAVNYSKGIYDFIYNSGQISKFRKVQDVSPSYGEFNKGFYVVGKDGKVRKYGTDEVDTVREPAMQYFNYYDSDKRLTNEIVLYKTGDLRIDNTIIAKNIEHVDFEYGIINGYVKKGVDYKINLGDNYQFDSAENNERFIEEIDDGVYIKVLPLSLPKRFEIPSEINDEAVIGISQGAFARREIEELIVPSSVTVIEDGAFLGMPCLKSLIINGNIEKTPDDMCSCCHKLETVKLPNSVKYIGNKAFEQCSSLNNVEFNGDRIIKIGEKAFNLCSNLEEADFVTKCTGEIGRSAFENAKSLKTLVLNDELKCLSFGAFSQCKNLKEVTLPKSIETIDAQAFYECENLKAINYTGDKIKLIDKKAFGNCSNLEASDFVEKCEQINDSAFCNCKKLNVSQINAKEIGKFAFGNTGITNLKINDGIKELEWSTFACCKNLESVQIPSTVKRIRQGIFDNCKKLKNIELMNPDCQFDEHFFENTQLLNDKLKESPFVILNGILIGAYFIKGKMVIPNGVKKILRNAFDTCGLISSVVFPESFDNDLNFNQLMYKRRKAHSDNPEIDEKFDEMVFYGGLRYHETFKAKKVYASKDKHLYKVFEYDYTEGKDLFDISEYHDTGEPVNQIDIDELSRYCVEDTLGYLNTIHFENVKLEDASQFIENPDYVKVGDEFYVKAKDGGLKAILKNGKLLGYFNNEYIDTFLEKERIKLLADNIENGTLAIKNGKVDSLDILTPGGNIKKNSKVVVSFDIKLSNKKLNEICSNLSYFNNYEPLCEDETEGLENAGISNNQPTKTESAAAVISEECDFSNCNTLDELEASYKNIICTLNNQLNDIKAKRVSMFFLDRKEKDELNQKLQNLEDLKIKCNNFYQQKKKNFE